LDSRHSVNVQPRKKLTQHLPYSDVIARLSKHFYRLEMDEESDTVYAPLATAGTMLGGAGSSPE